MPCPCPCSPLLQVHTEDYVHKFNTGTLDDAAVRRIGFGELSRTQLLIDRTKSEVAGGPLVPAQPCMGPPSRHFMR